MSLSPKRHPNAFGALSSGSVASFLVYEAKTRLGVELTLEEAGFIVASLISLYLYLGKKVV